MMARTILVGVVSSAVVALAAEQHQTLNPVRKVIVMLQSMQSKVQEEGVEELNLYNKFMCYCTTGDGDLSASIGSAEEKIPAVTSSIEASEAKLSGTKSDLKQAQGERSAALQAMAEATAVRKNEAASYAGLKAEADTNIAAIAKAVAALEKGMAGSFLQTPAAQVLRRIAAQSDIPESDQQELTAFLSQTSDYAPQSGQITGILKQMGDTMTEFLGDSTATEVAAIKTYKGLMAAKTKEVLALTARVESKTKQIGELGVAIVMMKEDLADTEASLAEDQKFLGGLKKSCATKTVDWEERSKTRAEELVALADTIKVLNDDDALELFKKTLPSPGASLIQLGLSARVRALTTVKAARAVANDQDRPRLELLALTLAGKSASKGAFDKVLKMIDEMVVLLKEEQLDDDHKKEYCAVQFEVSDDSKKALERTVAQEISDIAATNEALATLAQEIAALEKGIRGLDKSVAEATQQRKEENTEFKALVASDTAAKEVLVFAKNRLNQFYNPKLYKPAPKVELSAEDRIVENMGGVVSTAAPSGIAGTGITVLAQMVASKDAPAPPPDTWDAYAAKSGESTGVIAMIDLLIKDLQKELTEGETSEKDAQADYSEMMKDSAAKRTADSQSLTEKGSAKASMEEELQAHKKANAAAGRELRATLKYIFSLHAECDWLLQYSEVRKEARTNEIESLTKAKAVLSGADYSLLQSRAHSFLGRLQ